MATDPTGVIAGTLTEISRSHCVLTLGSDLLTSLSAHNELGSLASKSRADGSGIRWAQGAHISVSVTAASEIFKFSARIRDLIARPNGILLVVSRPSILVRIQRRKHARVPLAVPATIERAWMSPDAACDSNIDAMLASIPVHGTVRDLSGGGLRAHLGGVDGLQQIDTLLRRFQPDAIVRIRLPFPTLPHGSVLARIVSSGRAVTSGGLTVAVACEFLPMPTWEQEIVIQHVFQFQREMNKARKMRRHGGQPGLPQ